MSEIVEKTDRKYYQLMEELKFKILSGEILPGDKLMSENELATKYHISRHTVRKALGILQNEGYIYAEHGKGTFCSEKTRNLYPSKNIAVIMTYLSDYIFPRVIAGIDSVLTAEGYSIILKNTRNSRKKEADYLEELLQKNIDGIIIEPSKSQIYCKHLDSYKKLEKYKIPYVFIQGYFPQLEEKTRVLLDDCEGGYMITKYLLSMGHRKIIGVFKADDIQGQNRHKGYVKALQEYKVLYDPDKVVWYHTEDRKIHPYESIQNMIELGEQIDAVVAYNDQIAVDVIKAITDAGLRVPEDISVTGYDDSHTENLEGIKLTTIVHPQEKLGEIAAKQLLDIINKKTPDCTSVLIKPELIIGNSCKNKKENIKKL